MDEIALKKLYYQDIAQYKASYERRFHASTSVKMDFRVGEHQAFFTQSNSLIKTMYNILRLDRDILALCCRLPDLALTQYSQKCLIDEIVLTNEIEGVHSSRKEIGEALSILERQSAGKRRHVRFLGMVNQYRLLSQGRKLPLQTCDDIRMLYDELVLSEVLAENEAHRPDGRIFRKDQTELTSPTGKVIHTGVMPEQNIIDRMTEALRFLNDESVEPLYRICAFHYFLEYIHPFYDGNGRLGRFIVSYCISEILHPLLAYRLSQTIRENIRSYYDSFRVCNDYRNMGEITPFMTMMLHMIERAGMDLRESLGEKAVTLERYSGFVDSDAIPGMSEHLRPVYDLLIQAALFSERGFTAEELQGHLGLSYGTVKSRLRAIAANTLLSTEKHGRQIFYKLDIRQMDQRMLS